MDEWKCMMQYLYWEEHGKVLECDNCPFHGDCEVEDDG